MHGVAKDVAHEVMEEDAKKAPWYTRTLNKHPAKVALSTAAGGAAVVIGGVKVIKMGVDYFRRHAEETLQAASGTFRATTPSLMRRR